MGLPEAQRFWREFPRLRILPDQEIEVQGSQAFLTRIQSVTGSAELLGWFGLAMTAAALVNVYLFVYLAHKDLRFPLLVGLAAVAQERADVLVMEMGCV